MKRLKRRTFLAGAVAVMSSACQWHGRPARVSDSNTGKMPAPQEPSHGLGAEEVDSPTMRDGSPALRVTLHESDGSPLSPERAKLLHARDLHNDPLPQSIATAQGRARIELNKEEPIQLSCRLKVPGFGEVYCYADNDGAGYTQSGTIDFVFDAARTRIRRVNEAYDRLQPTIGREEDVERSLTRAIELFGSRPIASSRLPHYYKVLAHALHAGEQLTLAAAKHRIQSFQPRRDFLFGVMVSGFSTLGPKYEQAIRDAFNFATVSWYSWKPQPPANPDDLPIDYARMDQSIQWCLDRNITPKTFGYLYMARGATPEWLRPPSNPAPLAASRTQTQPTFNPSYPYEKIRALYPRIIKNTAQRFGAKVPHIEVMNEAHDKANLWKLSHAQLLELARLAFAAAKDGGPLMRRQMNHCCLWAEYAKDKNPDGSRRWSPYQFVKECFDKGIDYETIGLQLYYPQHDLFEIERMLDRFAAFNKPIHITELATASQSGLDPTSMRPATEAPMWHEPGWTPSTQADWVEQVYTLLYSKHYIQAVGWWDLTDVQGHFWPFGGLLDKDLNPKESYHRLRKLQKQWGVARPSQRT